MIICFKLFYIYAARWLETSNKLIHAKQLKIIFSCKKKKENVKHKLLLEAHVNFTVFFYCDTSMQNKPLISSNFNVIITKNIIFGLLLNNQMNFIFLNTEQCILLDNLE